MAKAIANGEAPVNGCPVGGDAVAAKIARIMGQEAGESIRRVAFVKCGGTCDKAKESCHYYGVHDCEMMDFIPGGGPKTCHYGCIGDSCYKWSSSGRQGEMQSVWSMRGALSASSDRACAI